MFQHWNNGGGFKICWYSCLAEGQVENVSENPFELLRTCPEDKIIASLCQCFFFVLFFSVRM